MKIIVYKKVMTYYRYLQHYYEITTAALRLYYGSAGYTSLHHSTCHYSHYGHYRFRGKVPEFAEVRIFSSVLIDVCWPSLLGSVYYLFKVRSPLKGSLPSSFCFLIITAHIGTTVNHYVC